MYLHKNNEGISKPVDEAISIILFNMIIYSLKHPCSIFYIPGTYMYISHAILRNNSEHIT